MPLCACCMDPKKCCLYVPAGLKPPKSTLFESIGSKLGKIVRAQPAELAALPLDWTPVVGCSPELTPIIDCWRKNGRPWVYWDRGYWDRVYATWLPRGTAGGMYRWHVGEFQLQRLRDVPADRYEARKPPVKPWQKGGRHVVIAAPTRTYSKFHQTRDWIADTIDALARVTDRQLVIRDKETKRSLQQDIEGAHALVTHGSISAVESVILGCPVFVHSDSAASLVGQTDLKKIETPVYPDRDRWLHSLAYSQYNEAELVNGTLWKLLE